MPASVLTMVAIFSCSQSVSLYRHCTEFVPLDYRTGLANFVAEMKSRAVHGFESGGPTRTRTVDQRIMSCDLMPQA
ncbi:hypothetical protein DZA21_04170 [Pseudomonas aeruginosa]|nr:hypothetical protein DZA21_04170 [Pseudomonas aeruginosa]